MQRQWADQWQCTCGRRRLQCPCIALVGAGATEEPCVCGSAATVRVGLSVGESLRPECFVFAVRCSFTILKCLLWWEKAKRPAEYFFCIIVNAINSVICEQWILIGIPELRGLSKCVDCCFDSGINVSDVLVMQREKCMGGGGLKKKILKILRALNFVLHCRHWKSELFWWGMYVIFVSQLWAREIFPSVTK